MNIHTSGLSGLMMVAQAVTIMLFSTGFVGYYTQLWRGLRKHYPHKTVLARLARLSLPIIAIAVAWLLNWTANGKLLPIGGLMQHGMALFMVTFLLLDEAVWPSEFVVRLVGLVAIWPLPTGRWGMLAGVVMLVWVAVIGRFGAEIRYHIGRHVSSLLVIACVYWLIIPKASSGFTMNPLLTVQAIILSGCAVVGAAIFLYRMQRDALQSAANARKATYDALTNAKTYARFQSDLTARFEAARASARPLTMVALDVDRFKQVNDQYGHLAGNAVLIGVANTLQAILDVNSGTGQLYRTGGEEFSIVLPEITPEASLPLVQACWQAVRTAVYSAGDSQLHVTLSAGITALQPEDVNIEALYKRADANLYQSKQHGRDTITIDGHTLAGAVTAQPYELAALYPQKVVAVATAATVATRVRVARYQAAIDRWQSSRQPAAWLSQKGYAERLVSTAPHGRLMLGLNVTDCLNRAVTADLADLRKQLAGLTVVISDQVAPEIRAMAQTAYAQHDILLMVALTTTATPPKVDGVAIDLAVLRRELATTVERQAWLAQCPGQVLITGIDNQDDAAYVRDSLHQSLVQGGLYDRAALPRVE